MIRRRSSVGAERVAGALVLCASLGLFGVGASGARAAGLIDDVEGYHFVFPDVSARPGDRVDVEVQGLHEQSVQGFQLVARYPSDQLTIERMHVEDTILEAIRVDFFETRVDAGQGYFTVGVLVDTRPPFDGALIPNIGRPMTLVHVEATVSAAAEDDLRIFLEDELSNPPLYNLFVVDNTPRRVDELSEGFVRLLGPETAPAFLRGDANMDEVLDVSDAIGILAYRFLGAAAPGCLASADANDDEAVDLSDAIYVLDYLYLGGVSPPPPMPDAGVDPTPSDLGCAEPLFYVQVGR